ncbi:MAG: radical SAM protein [Calditrichaeota bacterium]|nr:MAG: radical SAM protein [Calditrichota bacterium]
MPIVFGPVPSRRLGRSLGINNIPYKWCSFACIYCQIGDTIKLRYTRHKIYDSDYIFKTIQKKLIDLEKQHEPVDYLAFVPDGEPTLDINLGEHIRKLKKLSVPIAVITNASLISDPHVQDELSLSDWISLKVDAVDPLIWKKIDRPHGKLNHQKILEGMLSFKQKYKGILTTETMLVNGINDFDETAAQTGDFLKQLQPDIAYLSIPTRPPADKNIKPATPESVNRVWQIISPKIKRVELLTGYEGNAFASSGDIKKDILSITAVHPMRQDAVDEMLSRFNKKWELIDQMIEDNELIKANYDNHNFYLRKF